MRGCCRSLGWVVILLGILAARSPARAAESVPDSPAELWNGYDAEALPLERQTIRSWTEEGIQFESLRFTGEIHDGNPVRVFAIEGAPQDGKKLPGILHVHGGGQTASLEWVKYWARRGYVCVTFDFCGPWEGRTVYTDWGSLTAGNMRDAGSGIQDGKFPRDWSWYHWALVSRRALTLLAHHPQVDPERLGVFGISVGGTLTWMIAGADSRVKAAAPIYGCGYNYDQRNVRFDQPEPGELLRQWQRVLSPEAHAPYINCPVLFLSATNDFHGLMDRAYEALAAVPAPVRQVFTPRYNHHVEPHEGRSLALWMDWHLKGSGTFPKTPTLKLAVDGTGVPQVHVAPDDAANVEQVEVFYHLGAKRPAARFWRRAVTTPAPDTFVAPLPVLDVWDDLQVFANVTYRSGVCLTSPLVATVPGQLGKARGTLARTLLMEHGTSGVDHWYFTNAYTDPSIDLSYLSAGEDPEAGAFISLDLKLFHDRIPFRLSTHIPGDPQFAPPDGASLALKVSGDFQGESLQVAAVAHDWAPQSKTYIAKIPPQELAGGWHDVVLPAARFAAADGSLLPTWKGVDRIELIGEATRKDPPRFARLRWEPLDSK